MFHTLSNITFVTPLHACFPPVACRHTEIYLHHMAADVVSVTRNDPLTLDAVVLITKLVGWYSPR